MVMAIWLCRRICIATLGWTSRARRRSAQRRLAEGFVRQLRSERLAAYSGFVRVLTEFRRGELNWFRQEQLDPHSTATAVAKAESFRLRGSALTSLAEVRLVAGNPAVVAAASEAWDLCRKVRRGDEAGLDARADAARETLNIFAMQAAAEVQSLPTAKRADRDTSASPATGAQPGEAAGVSPAADEEPWASPRYTTRDSLEIRSAAAGLYRTFGSRPIL